MGDVLSAEDNELRRTVALKLLRPVGSADDASATETFFREARVASALSQCPDRRAPGHAAEVAGRFSPNVPPA